MKVEYIAKGKVEIERLGEFRQTQPLSKEQAANLAAHKIYIGEVELSPAQEAVFNSCGYIGDSEGNPMFKVNGKLQERPKPAEAKPESKKKSDKGGN